MLAIKNWLFNGPPSDQKMLFTPGSPWFRVFMIGLFLLAGLIRLSNLHAPGHLIDREYTSAIFARAFYYQDNPRFEDWQREIAVTVKNQQPILEPPLNEYLVSIIYRLAGNEDLTYARFLTIFFWLLGGIFLYKSARELVGVDQAALATAYYLFLPMGIIISRSFQPDALMMLLYLASLYTILLYFKKPTGLRLAAAGLLSCITLLIRPLVAFGLLFSFLAFVLYQRKSWKGLFDKSFLIFSIASLTGPALYYGYGILVAGYMRWKIPTSFMPHLLTKVDFWQGWFELGAYIFGYEILVFIVVGFFIIESTRARIWAAAMAISYLIFGILFTYHIHTHPYYHFVIIPMVSILAAPVMANIALLLKRLPGKTWLLPAAAAFLLIIFFSYDRVTDSFQIRWYERPEAAREIGDLVNHSDRVVFVASYYGVPLEYYGEFGGAPWPVRIEDPFYRSSGETERSVQERIDALAFTPEFFVITNFDLYQRKHQDLQEYLEENWKLLKENNEYLVYTVR